MKTYRKIFVGLATLATVLVGLSVLSSKAMAADYNPTFWDNANYSLTNNETVQVSNGALHVSFINPGGNTFPKGTFRVGGGLGLPPGICGTSNVITADNPSNLDTAKIAAALNVGYETTTAGSNGQQQQQCRIYQKNVSITNPKAGGTCSFVTCSKNDIKGLADSNFSFTSPSTIKVSFKNRTINFTDGNISDNDHTFQAPSGLFCSGSGRDGFGAISINDAAYDKVTKTKTDVLGSLDVDWYDASSKKCNDFGTDSNGNTSALTIDATLLANLEGTACTPPGATLGNLICGGTNNSRCNEQGCVWATATGESSDTSASDGNACEAENNTGLEWLICGVLRGMDGFMDKINGFIEDQLTIDVGQNLNANVHQAWGVFRTISSALLVIILLIMVFSQAISAGPFDAYTIRKLLPKLVAAVIIIQLSWYFSGWAIGIANDLGKGIAALISAPFGGTDQLGFDKLVGQLGAAVPGALVGGGLLAAIIAVAITPFGALMLGFFIVTGALVATAVLLVRQAIIIGAVIFMPLAFVAWILPGTQKYWKILWENFTKALLLFPLIIGMLYVGRVFAWIVATKGGSTGILDVFAVAIGFFGPYFLLPKAFGWGGNLMKAAASGIEKGVNKAGGEQGRKFIQDRQERLRSLRRARSAERFADPNKYKGASQLWQKPIDRFRGGVYDPTLGVRSSELRTQQKGAFLAEAEEYQEKRRREALGRFVKGEERLQEGGVRDADGNVIKEGGNKDDMYQDIVRLARGQSALKKYYDYNGNEIDIEKEYMGVGERNHEVARRAALDRMIQLGADTNWTHIDAEDERVRQEGTAEERAEWRKFLNDNKDQVLEKMPDLLKGTASVSDISADGIARMHGAGIKRMISKLDAAATDPRASPADRATAQARLSKFLTTYSEALNNSNLRGSLEQGGLRAVKAYVTRDDETRRKLLFDSPYKMHTDEDDGRLVVRSRTNASGGYDTTSTQLLNPIIAADEATGRVVGGAAAGQASLPANLRDELDAEIAPDGSFHGTTAPPKAAAPSPTEITIQHRETAARVLPPAATLDVAVAGPTATANREAFKFQVQTNPEVVQTLANGIASGAVAPQHQEVLEEMRTAAANVIADPAASDQQKAEARSNWNRISTQIQQAYQQKLEAVTAHAIERGVDPATARTAAMSAVDTTTHRTAAEDIQALMPGGGSPLSQL